MDFTLDFKSRFVKALKVGIIVVLIILVSKSIFGYGDDRSNKTEHTISFSGYGEVFAVPDIANIYFTISKEAKTVKEAQTMVTEVEQKVLAFLKDSKVLDKDIKTSNASFYPKYEYVYATKSLAPCTQYGCPPERGKNVITGYTASESINVKIRNTDDVGKIVEGLGSLGVTELSGPNFSVDDEDGLKAEARKKAIDDAKMKAKALARDLGVRLGGIVSFTESDGYNPPVYYMKAENAADSAGTSAPALPKGENTISSNVTITYKIK